MIYCCEWNIEFRNLISSKQMTIWTQKQSYTKHKKHHAQSTDVYNTNATHINTPTLMYITVYWDSGWYIRLYIVMKKETLFNISFSVKVYTEQVFGYIFSIKHFFCLFQIRLNTIQNANFYQSFSILLSSLMINQYTKNLKWKHSVIFSLGFFLPFKALLLI